MARIELLFYSFTLIFSIIVIPLCDIFKIYTTIGSGSRASVLVNVSASSKSLWIWSNSFPNRSLKVIFKFPDVTKSSVSVVLYLVGVGIISMLFIKLSAMLSIETKLAIDIVSFISATTPILI